MAYISTLKKLILNSLSNKKDPFLLGFDDVDDDLTSCPPIPLFIKLRRKGFNNYWLN